MSTVEQAYIKYKLKVEKNIKNDNATTDRGRFVLLFNESQNKFIGHTLQNRKSDDVRYIQKFLIPDKKLEENTVSFDRQDFGVPADIYDFSNIRIIASKDSCKRQEMEDIYELVTENQAELLKDVNNKPSFKWRAAPYKINSDSISIYNDNDFKVDYILLSYYRYPNQIALIEPDNPESEFNENIPIEWDEKALDIILSLTAGESDMNTNNPRFQLQQMRAQK